MALNFPDSPVPGQEYTDNSTTWIFDGVKWVSKAEDLNARYLRWPVTEWVPDEYTVNDVVRDGDWLMVANKTTSDRPAPQQNGDPDTVLPDAPPFATQANLSVVYSGHRYIFTEPGWLTTIRVWVSTLTNDTNYRFYIVQDIQGANPIWTVIEEPVLKSGEWVNIGIGFYPVAVGSDITIFIDSLNSGSTTPVTGGWTYTGSSQDAAPGDQSWNHNNQNNTLRIDKTDLDSLDRTSELLGIIPGSTIRFLETATPSNYNEYLVNSAATDSGDYITFGDVTLVANGGTISSATTCTMNATVPVVQSTDYVEMLGYWPGNEPTFATVEGFKQYDGVTQPGNEDTAYGVDIEFQRASVSEDWDYMSSTGAVGGGGGGTVIAEDVVFDNALTPFVGDNVQEALEEMGTAATYSIEAAQRKNLVINGNFDIWQRGTTGAGSGYVSCDRIRSSSANNTAFDRETNLALGGFYVLNLTASASTGAGFEINFEARDGVYCKNKTMSFSFYHSSDIPLDNLRYEVNTPDAFENYIAVTNDISGVFVQQTPIGTGNFYRYEFTFTPTAANYNNGMQVRIYSADSGAISNSRFGLVQLEVGQAATDFEYRPIAEELALCQRYFYRPSLATGFLMQLFRDSAVANNKVFSLTFPSQMRAGPTMSNITTTSGTFVPSSVTESYAEVISNDINPNTLDRLITIDLDAEL